MKIIHNASLIILVIDIFKKIPIDEVEILCNGIQHPYLKKDSGYFIFCNLQQGDYKIEIFSPGFIKKEINCTLNFGECKKIISEMSFKSNNPNISKLPRIELLIKDRDKNEILANQDTEIIMKNPVSFLKLINNSKKSSMEIILNVENIHSLHFQNYIYEFTDNSPNDEKNSEDENNKDEEKDDDESTSDEKDKSSDDEPNDLDNDKEDSQKGKSSKKNNENDKVFEKLFFLGYDIKYNAYILLNELKKDLKVGGQFFPFWNLSSDDKGKVIIPIFPKFMNRSFFKIEINVNGVSRIIKIDTSKFNKNNAIPRKISFRF